MAYFCQKSGVRIAGPGVSKLMDPENGWDEVVEVDGVEQLARAKKARPERPPAPAPSDDKPPSDEKPPPKTAPTT